VKLDRNDNYLKSDFCVLCKKVEMPLEAFWHNTVHMFLVNVVQCFGALGSMTEIASSR